VTTGEYQSLTLATGARRPTRNAALDDDFVVWMCVGGVVSGLLSIACLASPGRAGVFLGALFGTAMAVTLVAFRVLDSLWRAFCLIAGATVAYVIALCVAFGVQLAFPPSILLISPDERWSLGHPESVSPVALCAGGLVGAFVLLASVCSLATETLGIRVFVRKCALWAFAGGVLAVLGWALHGSLGVLLWHLLHFFGLTSPTRVPQDELRGLGQVSSVYAIHFVWQVGIALLLGLILRSYSAESVRKESTTK
jgi:hypothetical protein